MELVSALTKVKLEGVAVSRCSWGPFSLQGHLLMSALGGPWYKPARGWPWVSKARGHPRTLRGRGREGETDLHTV